MSTTLSRLAARAGIEDFYWDFFGNRHETSDETRRALLAAMGLPAGSEADARDGLERLDRLAWQRVLAPVAIFDERQGAAVSAVLPAIWDEALLAYAVTSEDGRERRGEVRVRDLEWRAEHRGAAGHRHSRRLVLPDLPVGDHRLVLALPDGSAAEQRLVVAPARAYSPPELERGRGLWGIATQLYALRREGDWGIGDFTALAQLCRVGAGLGAAAIGVNPLHALFGARPERYGPYAPSSRCFLNVAYIDVTAIPEFGNCEAARAIVPDPASLGGGLIDYARVGSLKLRVLNALHAHFRSERDGLRNAAFRAFQAQSGDPARRFAIFEALQECMIAVDPAQGSWRDWAEQYRHPRSPAVERFAQEKAERVDFFWWLQFVADEQSAAAQQACRDEGMPIGLYRDLGVGIAEDGAEAWSQQDCIALSVSIGAPPDPLAPQGQDWGLVPFDPLRLREEAYAPFRQVMAANMRHAGAMRLDHAMSLQRLYWVPRGMGADRGAYVRYPADDLFSLVALESQRQRCLVIGEDLGTVPEGFRERMADRNVFAYRVLYFETDQSGAFRPPEHYAAQALTTIGTHDLPSLRGWWQGYDIDLRIRLGLYPDPAMHERAAQSRAAERTALVAALSGRGLLHEDFPTRPLLDDAEFLLLMRAAHAFLNDAASRLVMTQIEDVLGLVLQMNLPGTTDQHPNWRLRYAMDIAGLAEDPRLRDVALGLLDDRDFRTSGAKTAG